MFRLFQPVQDVVTGRTDGSYFCNSKWCFNLAVRAGGKDKAGIAAAGFAVDDVHQVHVSPRIGVGVQIRTFPFERLGE